MKESKLIEMNNVGIVVNPGDTALPSLQVQFTLALPKSSLLH